MNELENPSNNLDRQGYLQKYPIGRIILACVLGILAGALQPWTMVMSILFCVTPVVISALYAWAGWIPAAAASLSAVVSTAVVMPLLGIDSTWAVMGTLLIQILPAMVITWPSVMRMKFFHRLTIAIAVQTAALLTGMAVIYLGLRIDLVDLMTQAMREGMGYMPVTSVTNMLQQFALYGILTEESINELSSGIVTAGDIEKVLDQAMEVMNYAMKQMLPAAVLSSGLLSGIAMTSVSSRIYRDCRVQPAAEHIMIDYWRVPPRFAGLMLVGTIAGYIMQFNSVNGSEAVTMVFSMLLMELLVLQGAAAISRRFREVRASRLSRLGLIAASLIFMPTFLEIAGILSLLIGSEGIITKWMKKRIEERESEDEDE